MFRKLRVVDLTLDLMDALSYRFINAGSQAMQQGSLIVGLTLRYRQEA